VVDAESAPGVNHPLAPSLSRRGIEAACRRSLSTTLIGYHKSVGVSRENRARYSLMWRRLYAANWRGKLAATKSNCTTTLRYGP
jgi:hypothetical protein